MGRYLELAKKACGGHGEGTPSASQSPPAMSGPDDLPADWRALFEERAAIMEYDGGLLREQAESAAMAETVRLMQAEKK
jgi:hypothetical protein